MTKFCIIGMGLMGGSLGLAIKKKFPGSAVYGVVRNRANIRKILQRKAADQVFLDPRSAIKDAQLIILAIPPQEIEKTLVGITPYLSEEQMITDVASVKRSVMTSYQNVISNKAHYIGSHPIAGSERSGIQAADASLFERCICIITPDRQSSPHIISQVRKFWRTLGASTQLMSAREHDKILSLVSHLPHLVSFALTGCASKRLNEIQYAGEGWRDMTRIAKSLPELWVEIAMLNREYLLRDIKLIQLNLNNITKCILSKNSGKLKNILSQFQSFRSTSHES